MFKKKYPGLFRYSSEYLQLKSPHSKDEMFEIFNERLVDSFSLFLAGGLDKDFINNKVIQDTLENKFKKGNFCIHAILSPNSDLKFINYLSENYSKTGTYVRTLDLEKDPRRGFALLNLSDKFPFSDSLRMLLGETFGLFYTWNSKKESVLPLEIRKGEIYRRMGDEPALYSRILKSFYRKEKKLRRSSIEI